MSTILGVVGGIGCLVFGVMMIVSLIKKNGKAKQDFSFVVLCIILLILAGVSLSKTEESSARTYIEDKVASLQEKEKEREIEKETPLLSTKEIQQQIKKGMSLNDYTNMEDTLGLSTIKVLDLGEGIEGRTVKGSDGFVVSQIHKKKVVSIYVFTTLAEVEKLEKDNRAIEKQEAEKRMKMTTKMVNAKFTEIIKLSKGLVITIKKKPNQEANDMWDVVMSDSWYTLPDYQKERLAESVGGAIEKVLKDSGAVNHDSPVLVELIDSYGKPLADETIWGGYKIKN